MSEIRGRRTAIGGQRSAILKSLGLPCRETFAINGRHHGTNRVRSNDWVNDLGYGGCAGLRRRIRCADAV